MNDRWLRFFVKELIFYLPHRPRSFLYGRIKGKRTNFNVKKKFRWAYSRYNAIFIHIPKTAGTSINQMLYGSKGTQHSGIWQVMSYFNEVEFEQAFKFTFVRHPLDRLVSSYFHLRGGGWGTRHDERFLTRNGPVAAKDFHEFVHWLSQPNMCYEHVVLIPQHEFVCLGRHAMVDFVGRFEQLDIDFAQIAERIGIDKPLTHENKTQHQGYYTYYDDELQALARQIYRRDFSVFEFE